MDPIIDKVNIFIKRMQNFEITISDKMKEAVFTDPADPDNNKSMAEYLVDSIWKFETGGLTGPTLQQATECLHWINRAYVYNFIEQNTDTLYERLEERNHVISILEKELADSKAELEKISTDLIFIQGKYEELDTKFNRMSPKGDIPR